MADVYLVLWWNRDRNRNDYTKFSTQESAEAFASSVKGSVIQVSTVACFAGQYSAQQTMAEFIQRNDVIHFDEGNPVHYQVHFIDETRKPKQVTVYAYPIADFNSRVTFNNEDYDVIAMTLNCDETVWIYRPS